jgi:hypothetical protein
MGDEGKAVGFPRLTALLSVRSHERASRGRVEGTKVNTHTAPGSITLPNAA